MARLRRESLLESQVVLVGAQALQLVMGLVITVVTARSVDSRDFGVFILAASAFTMAGQLVEAGLGAAVTAELARDPLAGGRFFRSVMGLRSAAAAALAVVGAVALPRLGIPVSGAVVVAVVLSQPLRGWQSRFASRRINRLPALTGTLAQIVFLAAALGAARAGAGVGAVICGLAVREILRGLLPALLARPVLGPLQRAGPADGDADPARRGRWLPEPVRALLWLGLATGCGSLYFHLDVFMLRAWRGSEAVGEYGLALRLVVPLLATVGLLAAPLVPFLSEGTAGGRLRPRDGVLFAAVAIGPVAVFVPFGAELAGWLAGAPRPAAGAVLEVLAFAPAAVVLGAVSSLALISERRYRTWFLVTATGAAVNVALNAAMIPAWGELGAARATLVTELGVGVAAAAFTRWGRGARIRP